MKNPKGLIITIILVALPIILFILMLQHVEDEFPTISGDFKDKTDQINEIANQYVDEANNNTQFNASGEFTSGEYMSSKYGNPISKLIENAKISVNSAIVYEEPSEEANVVASVNKDVVVTAQNYDNNWSQIKFGEISGWIRTSNISEPDDGSSQTIKSPLGKEGTVIVDALNVRAAATTVGDPIDQISMGDKFKVIDTDANNTWLNIQYGTKNGWIKGDPKYVQIEY